MVHVAHMDLPVLCGQLIVTGLEGTSLSPTERDALARAHVGGVIYFRRNIPRTTDGAVDVPALAALSAAVVEAFASSAGVDGGDEREPVGAAPIVAVDQEGGRVARLGAPFLRLPPMATLGALGDPALITDVARAQARELAAVGITMNFAPVLDVHSRPENPVIGDRAFGTDAVRATEAALAFARGTADRGVLSCGKHFPGHGDTTTDSHLELPRVEHPRARLDAVELAPFCAAIRAGLPSLMTAHVVYDALDPGVPATLSRRIATDLLRNELGYGGVLVSDDLEMKAIAASMGADEAAVRAIEAGCDLLLVCTRRGARERAHAALVERAERDVAFRSRCEEACARVLAMRRAFAPRGHREREHIEAVFASPDGLRVRDALARALETHAATRAGLPNPSTADAADPSTLHDPTEREHTRS